MCIITKHAKRRIKLRLSIPPNKMQSYVDRAYSKGITHSEATGELRKYFDGLYLQYNKANNIRVYHNTVFIFTGKVLLTVLQLPKKLIDYIKENMQDEEIQSPMDKGEST